MNRYIECRLVNLPHPFPKDATSKSEAWGEFTIVCNYSNKSEVLLRIQWNLDSLIEAYLDRVNKLFVDPLPNVFNNESLAQAFERLTHQEFEELSKEEEEWQNVIYEYLKTHSLRFWLRGVDIPTILIGINHSLGEISLYLEEPILELLNEDNPNLYYKAGSWQYEFEPTMFTNNFTMEAKKFLKNWLSIAKDKEGIDKATELLNRFENLPHKF